MSNIIQDVKDASDCRVLFGRFWPGHFKDSGNSMCPFHGDSDPSLSLNKDKAHCHGSCGKSWSAIDLYALGTGRDPGLKGKELFAVIKEMAQELGIHVPDPKERTKKSPPTGSHSKTLINRWKEFLASELTEDALKYLTEERSIPLEVIEELKRSGIIGFCPTFGDSGAVEFPVLDWHGKTLVSIQHIPVGGGVKKFAKGTEAKKGFFKHGNGGDHAVISEAVLDSLSIYAACKGQLFLDAISIFSSNSYGKLKHIPNIIPTFFMDDDLAGITATVKSLKMFGPGRAKFVDWTLADGEKDANQLLKNGKAPLILAMVKGSIGTKSEDDLLEKMISLIARARDQVMKKEYKHEEDRLKVLISLDKLEAECKDSQGKTDTQEREKSSSGIYKNEGAYWKTEFTAAGPSPKKLANFTLSILRNFSAPSGMTRLIKITQEGGFTIDAEISSGVMVSRQLFSGWMLGQGNFLFKGSQADLEKLWELELSENDGKVIFRPDHIGWVQRQELWLFSDCAVKDGKVYDADQDGIYWVDDRGYQPMAIDLGETKDEASSCVPSLDWRISGEVVDKARHDMVRLLKQNLGGYEAYLVLGFVAACAYLDEIFREYKFPILFIFGRRQCGKNTLANILMSHWGLGEWSSDNVVAITKAALARKLAYYSNVPVWVDEYRSGDPKCQEKDSLLRSAYDRVGGSKGTIGPGVMSPRVRAPLIVTGEGFPVDSALTSRCAMVQLSEGRRFSEAYQEIRPIIPHLSGVFLSFLRNKSAAKSKKILEDIAGGKAWLEKEGMDPRLAAIYATLISTFENVYYPEINAADAKCYGEWVKSEAHQMKAEKEDKLLTNTFLYDLEVMRAKGILNGDHVELETSNIDGWCKVSKVFVWLHGVYNAWAKDRRERGENAWSYQDVQKYLREEPYYKEETVKKINKKARRAMVLDGEKLPLDILNVFVSGWGNE